MRKQRLIALLVASTAFAVVGMATPPAALAQSAGDQQADATQSPPKPYKPVAVTLPQPPGDPSFAGFRQQLATIAAKKDRTALARIVAQNFFWVPDEEDIADKRKSGIDKLAAAISLEGRDSPGWESLTAYARETTADPSTDAGRKGVICAPGEPKFDETAAEELATATETEAAEWGYPAKDAIDVRSGPEPKAPVIGKLGLHLVRIYPDDSPSAAVHAESMRIVLPSGKLGFVPFELLLPLQTDQLCYVKDGNVWKIAGVVGGGTPGQ